MISLVLASLVISSAELDLQWSAPSGCPDQFDVEFRVADLVGRAITLGPDAAWSARAQVLAAANGYTTNLQVRSVLGAESRRLQDPDCEALADAVAVILALTLDSGPPPSSAQVPHAPPAQTATVTSPRSRVVHPRETTSRGPGPVGVPWGLGASVEAGTHFGLPDPGIGVSATLLGRLGAWSLGAGGTVRRSGARVVAQNQTIQVEGVAGLLRVCRGHGRQVRFGLSLCVSSELGRLRLRAQGLAMGEADVWWAQTALEPTFSARLQPGLRGFIRTQLLLGLVRPRGRVILADDNVPGFQVPRWSAGMAIGLRSDFF